MSTTSSDRPDPGLGPSALAGLAGALEAGLLLELRLTPKPGLVDRADCGSHPDLSYRLMARSVALVGGAFRALAASLERGEPLGDQVALAEAAEARLLAALGANTHRGALFLGGLVLAARWRLARAAPDGAAAPPGPEAGLRGALRSVAGELSDRRTPPESHGARARRRFGVGGVVGEAAGGLPSVFEAALPAWRAARARGRHEEEAAFAALAALMEVVEDTTTLHRGGTTGLARLRRDGRELARRLREGEDHLAFLAAANEAWRAERLTMGGVADLLGVALGLLVEAGELRPSRSGAWVAEPR